MRSPWMRAAVVALCAFVAAPVHAQTETMTVGVEELLYYPHYTIENNEYAGFGRAVLDAFAADAKVRLEYRPLPVARLYHQFIAGDVDFKYPDSPHWSTEMKTGRAILYSEPVVDYIDGVVVPPQRVGQPASEIKKLGTVLGFTPWSWNDLIQSGATSVAENSDFSGLLQQTLRGRVDGAYVNVAVARYQLASRLHQPDALVYDPGLPHTADSYRLSTIKRPETLRRFNDWLAAHPETLVDLKKKFGV